MAESGLSIQYSDLVKEVAHFLGYNRNQDLLTKDQLAEVDLYIQAGVRQFYYPPAVNGVESGYEWSFLKPTATLATTASDAAQDLPDDCGRVLGDFFFAPNIHCRSIPQVSEGFLQSRLQQSTDAARPQYATVRVKDDGVDDDDEREPTTTGQRLEVAWWPIPDDAYTLTFKYEAYSGKLTEDLPYPLGSMKHGELIVESCLAVAEQRANDEKGLHWDSFVGLLKAGVAQDRKQGAGYYGHMGGLQDGDIVTGHGHHQSSHNITYDGDTW